MVCIHLHAHRQKTEEKMTSVWGSTKWQLTPVFLPGDFLGTEELGTLVHGVAKSQTQPSDYHSLTRCLRYFIWAFLFNFPILWAILKERESEATQSCPTLCDPMDYSLPVFSVHGIFQARILEWDFRACKKGETLLISFLKAINPQYLKS